MPCLRSGLQAGDRVASWMGKTALACILPLACARARLVHVPINPVLRRAQAAHILADSGARLLIANQARLESLEAGDEAQAELVALEEWRDGDTALPPSVADPDDLAALLYTSGSTGLPKGVMLSHANLWLGAISVAHFLGLSPSDRTLALLPLAFDYGQNQLLSTWAAGGSVIAFDYLMPRDVVRAVGRHDVTVLAGVPPLWLQLAEADWSGGEGTSLQNSDQQRRAFARAAGAPPAQPVSRGATSSDVRADRSLPLDQPRSGPGRRRIPTASAAPFPFAEVMVVRPDGSEAAPGEEGELVHAGPLVAKGYWRDPVRTAERFRPAPSWSISGGTAVWSGDSVVRGADGLLRFRGRDDAMIKVSGNRISPTEIEEAALASGAVRDAAALGVPDERLGQAIILFAVAKGDEAETRA